MDLDLRLLYEELLPSCLDKVLHFLKIKLIFFILERERERGMHRDRVTRDALIYTESLIEGEERERGWVQGHCLLVLEAGLIGDGANWVK